MRLHAARFLARLERQLVRVRRLVVIWTRAFSEAASRKKWQCSRNKTHVIRGSSGGEKRNHLAACEWPLGKLLPAGNYGSGLRLYGLRQRRLDGHLPGEQRTLRFLRSKATAAKRTLQEQSRRHVHGCNGTSGSRRRRIWDGRGGWRL